jgi:hypothetical protein
MPQPGNFISSLLLLPAPPGHVVKNNFKLQKRDSIKGTHSYTVHTIRVKLTATDVWMGANFPPLPPSFLSFPHQEISPSRNRAHARRYLLHAPSFLEQYPPSRPLCQWYRWHGGAKCVNVIAPPPFHFPPLGNHPCQSNQSAFIWRLSENSLPHYSILNGYKWQKISLLLLLPAPPCMSRCQNKFKKKIMPKLLASNLGSASKIFGGSRPAGLGGDRNHTP